MLLRRVEGAARQIEPRKPRFGFNRIAFAFLHLLISRRSLVDIAELQQRVTEQRERAALTRFDFRQGQSAIRAAAK